MSDNTNGQTQTAPKKRLRVGQTFQMAQTEGARTGGAQEGQAGKPKTQLKKQSEPYESRQKIEREKQAQANSYWDMAHMQSYPAQQYQAYQHPQAVAQADNYFQYNPNMNLHNLNKHGGTLMDEITFDEEEFRNDPKAFLDKIPEEYIQDFENKLLESQIDEIINDLDEENADHFEESSRSCTCCHGWVNKCKGKICQSLGVCQCMARNEMEQQAVEHFIAECKDCACCRGYVYVCMGPACQAKGSCVCFTDE